MGDIKRSIRKLEALATPSSKPPPKRWTANRLFNHILYMLSLIEQYDAGKIKDEYQITYNHDVEEVVDIATRYIADCVVVFQVPHADVGLNTLIALRDALTIQHLSVQPAADVKLWTYLERLPNATRFIMHQHGNAGDGRAAAIAAGKRYVSEESDKHVDDMTTYLPVRPSEFSNEVAELEPRKQLLGLFEYHHHKVVFEATEDEREYFITIWQDTHNHPRAPKDPQRVMNYHDLSPARGAFQQVVHDLMGLTSLSDVSLYMQQHAKPSPQ